MKRLLIIAHAPSPNIQRMIDAVLKGANSDAIDGVEAIFIPALEANADDVLKADALILGTPENLGYMSGALKDFFDRNYYPCMDKTEAMPCAILIRAGNDGTGTRRALESILTGLRWKIVQEPLICRGDFKEEFIDQAEELGLFMAASLEAGII
ncbi:MAG: NAD(P)H-dependent oxidoreductase [Cycloclasticus sp.]|jgi:multimeric flavodoxin WrbA|nr:NAD(P)H-dependent oxidoreductase [Cycloclasticus sp.]MEE4291252.1 NAD(P)H-dependent oxidoreductase [Cycloclasticus sp.]